MNRHTITVATIGILIGYLLCAFAQPRREARMLRAAITWELKQSAGEQIEQAVKSEIAGLKKELWRENAALLAEIKDALARCKSQDDDLLSVRDDFTSLVAALQWARTIAPGAPAGDAPDWFRPSAAPVEHTAAVFEARAGRKPADKRTAAPGQVFQTSPYGKKYHAGDCRFMKDHPDAEGMTPGTAESQGLRPCKICIRSK